ncbi:MAG: hypothetical protein ACYDDA_11635 [Acidiferrobacteraceae bacterium]
MNKFHLLGKPGSEKLIQMFGNTAYCTAGRPEDDYAGTSGVLAIRHSARVAVGLDLSGLFQAFSV